MEKHIGWLNQEEDHLEKTVLSEYSSSNVRKHLAYLTTLTRMAGTDDERKAAEYIKGELDEYAIEADIHEFEAYISHPGRAELEILFPVQKILICLAHGFIASTPLEGLEAELIPVGKGSAEDLQASITKGKIVLVEEQGQFRSAEIARNAEESGALGQIFIARGRPRSIGRMRLRNSWGAPIPETIDKIPKTPAVSVCREDGAYLNELARQGRIVVRLKADSWRGYKKVRQPIGILRGVRDPEKYVLCSAHYCSWYNGATDNAAANSLLLEMARIFSKYRNDIGRSIRFAWWTGHSQGSSAGSDWYADNFWEDIRNNAIAYLNMDGLARAGSAGFEPENSEEIRTFHEGVIKDILHSTVTSKRVKRSGDQSFWGIGLPSFTGATKFASSAGGERVWYSHAAEDTLDKVDLDLLEIPFKVNAVSVLRLCNCSVLPFNFATLSEVLNNALQEIQEKSRSALDLTSLIARVEELTKKANYLSQTIEKKQLTIRKKKIMEPGIEKNIRGVNACIMELSHILLPAISTKSGKYGQDPMGTKMKLVPALQPLLHLMTMDNEGEEFKALRTFLLKERNKLSDAINSAHQTMDCALNILTKR